MQRGLAGVFPALLTSLSTALVDNAQQPAWHGHGPGERREQGAWRGGAGRLKLRTRC